MNFLTTRASLVFASVALLLAAAQACTSAGGGGGGVPCSDAGTCPNGMVCQYGACVNTGTGGANSGGTGGGSSQLCATSCTKAAAANCPSYSSTNCESSCASAGSQVPANCQSAWSALLACSASAPWQCDANGDAYPVGCEAQNNAFGDCITSGVGGFGGSGGSIVGGSGGMGGFSGTGASGGFGGTLTGGTGGMGGTGGGTVTNVTPSCSSLPSTPPSGGSCYSGNCNPMTNSGCTGSGEACDISNSGGFECFPPPNDAACGASCDNTNGPFCQPGYICAGSGFTQCARYCCTDADCGGATGSCVDMSADLGTTVKICGTKVSTP